MMDSIMNQKSRTRWRNKCDALWYQIQHQRWKSCAVCGSPAVEIHHLIPKNGHSATRTELDNAIPLCEDHHKGSDFSAHGTPEAFSEWLKEKRPWDWIYIGANQERVERVDWKERYDMLKSEGTEK